jgi:phage host-nuclease inhibitor protein Gam
MSNRKRKASPVATVEPVTEEEMKEALASYAQASTHLDVIEATAKRAVEKLKVKVAERAAPWAKQCDAAHAIVQRYAVENKDDFSERRMKEVYGGHKIGFRTCPASVQFVRMPGEKKKQTEQGFLAACHALISGGHALFNRFIRTKEEINKEAVIHHVALAEVNSVETGDPTILAKAESEIALVGVAVSAGENFVIELNLQPEAPAA